MTLIRSSPLDKTTPAVHALVIGVAEYPYLSGGSKKTLPSNGGLGQLASPGASAAAFCRWLQSSFRPPNLQLGSVEVLCSEGSTFVNEAAEAVEVARPTMRNVRKAAREWLARGDQQEQNFLLFYFCGHGVSSGLVQSLLLENFGKDAVDPFTTGAIDAEAFMDGARTAKATRQLFLIDACRSVGHAAFQQYGVQRGAPVISAAPHTRLGIVEQAALWATSLGSQSYGMPGQPSVFMSAMLHAMHGGGALQDPNDGKWVIQPDMLKRAIDHIIQRAPQFSNSGLQFTSLERMVKGIPVHMLTGEPSVPVQVNCNPSSRNSVTEFRCSSGDRRAPGQPDPWHLDLTSDRYVFHAVSAGSGRKRKDVHPHPPYSIVSFDFTP
jgi:hypothetical protein